MAEKDGKKGWVMVNRAPVLMLWAAVVAEVLGFEHGGLSRVGPAEVLDIANERPGKR